MAIPQANMGVVVGEHRNARVVRKTGEKFQ